MLPGFSPRVRWTTDETNCGKKLADRRSSTSVKEDGSRVDCPPRSAEQSRAEQHTVLVPCFFLALALEGVGTQLTRHVTKAFALFFVSRVSRSRACTRRYWQNPSTSEIISFIGASVCSAGAMSMPRHVPCYTVTWCTDYIQNYKLPALIQSVSLLKFHGDAYSRKKYDESIENETFIIKNKK